jgi:predicted ferric reductase
VSISVLDICAYVGLVAVGAVAFNMVLGMLMAIRYSPVRSWPHRKFNYFQLHNWSGYVALGAAILHPLILLLNKPTRFRMVDVVYPVHSPSQPLENTIGAVALYTVAIVVVTSYLRLRLGRRLWKSVHFTIYFAAVALSWQPFHRSRSEKFASAVARRWKGIHRGWPGPDRGHDRGTLAVFAEEGASIEPNDEAAVSTRLDV